MWPYTVSQNWVPVLFHCRWLLVSHPGVRQLFKATLYIFSDEYVGTRVYCWCMLLESSWAVYWETVSQTWLSSSQKRARRNSGKKAGRKANITASVNTGKGRSKVPLEEEKKGWGCTRMCYLSKLAAWRAQAVAETHWEASRPEKNCEKCSRVEEKP